MGKERKLRSVRRKTEIQKRRVKPKPPNNTIEGSIETLKQQMQMPNLEEKLCGLQALATLLEAEENIDALIGKNIVRIVAPLLIDECSTVRNAAAGTLRNFSGINDDACEHLVEQDIITLVIALLQKYEPNWVPKKTKTGHLDEDGDTFLQCMYLLWNLCEYSDVSITRLEESGLIPTIIRRLNKEIFGEELVVVILDCLFIMTEDNMNFNNKIKDVCIEHVKPLLAINSDEQVDKLIRIVALGTYLNLYSNHVANFSQEELNKVFEILSETLMLDYRTQCHQISSHLPLISELRDENMDENAFKEKAEVESKIKNTKYMAYALQVAIEILGNICSVSVDDCDQMDVDKSSESDELENEDDIDCENDGDLSNNVTIFISDKIAELIKAKELPTKLWQKIIPVAENVIYILEESSDGRSILTRLYAIQTRAMLCMNNLIESLPIASLNGCEGIYNMWTEVGKILLKTDVKNEELLKSITILMRASVERLKKEMTQIRNEGSLTNTFFNNIALSDIQIIFNGINDNKCDEVRINLYRMIGNLTLILNTKSEGKLTDIEIIMAQFLIDRIQKENELGVLAEIIDTLMDSFCEDESDELALKTNLVEKLLQILPVVKNLRRQVKRDHGPLINTVMVNLPRFIKYKKSRINLLLQKNGS